MPLSRIWRQTASLGVDLHLGRRVVQLDVTGKRVNDDHGEEYRYDRLLLATGGTPIQPWPAHPRLIYFRTLADYQRLRALTETGQRFAVIGGGFIGSEIAAVLTEQGKEVSMLFPEAGIGARTLPDAISQYLNTYFRERGVRVLNGHMAQQVIPDDQGVTVVTDQGETLRVDGVIAGLGIRPNVELAEAAGLDANNGILVDEALRTSQADIFAAGDVANFYSPLLGQRMRAEHEENANVSGMQAGQGMAGHLARYETLPAVYSTLFQINYDAVGELDPRLEVTYDWQEPFQKGVAYYLKDSRVRGVLLWNLGRGLDQARQIIAQAEPIKPTDLKRKISA